MAKLSPKQLAFAWINRCLEPARINPEREEFEELNGGEVTDKACEEAIQFIQEELAKLKERKYQPYVEKYVKGRVSDAKEETSEPVEDENY